MSMYQEGMSLKHYTDEQLTGMFGEDAPLVIGLRDMEWVGSFTVEQLLDNCFKEDYRPPEAQSVYIITRDHWSKMPTPPSRPLYVGTNKSSKYPRFRTRVGELIGAMFGLYNWGTTSHPAGAEIYEWCRKAAVNPKQLWIGWVTNCACTTCAETFLIRELEPTCNRKSGDFCMRHKAGLEGLTAFQRSLRG